MRHKIPVLCITVANFKTKSRTKVDLSVRRPNIFWASAWNGQVHINTEQFELWIWDSSGHFAVFPKDIFQSKSLSKVYWVKYKVFYSTTSKLRIKMLSHGVPWLTSPFGFRFVLGPTNTEVSSQLNNAPCLLMASLKGTSWFSWRRDASLTKSMCEIFLILTFPIVIVE